MDPLTLAAGVTAAVGLGIGFRLYRRAVRAEAQTARLLRELRAERHAAAHDPLTGLLNRRGFYRIGSELIAERSRPPLTGVLFDLDGFKQINDRLGHAVGDEVLILVAQRFANYAEGSPVARLGGDEFAGLLLLGGHEPAGNDPTATGLVTILGTPIRIGDHWLTVRVSVGLVPVSEDLTLAEVLHRADRAMYRAKSTGCGSSHFDPVRDEGPECQVGVRPTLRVRDFDTALAITASARTCEPA
ncbi:MAG TPA: GGDEF domain-containing protein [Micromonosporaceae bacterium]|nr:GGDEF domain-containing protein [Micromonosporaceae bacterium]